MPQDMNGPKSQPVGRGAAMTGQGRGEDTAGAPCAAAELPAQGDKTRGAAEKTAGIIT